MITINDDIKKIIAEKICYYSHPGNVDKCHWVTDGEYMWQDEHATSDGINIMNIADNHFSDYLEPQEVLEIITNKYDSFYLKDDKIYDLKQQDMYLAYKYVEDNYSRHLENLQDDRHNFVIEEICRYM